MTDKNVIGHSFDNINKIIDNTEGFGAFDYILKDNILGKLCLDVGGGKYDFNKFYVDYYHNIKLDVIDPLRSSKDNINISNNLKNKYDSCVSISVLNVIENKNERIEHIKLCYSCLKENGKAFFIIYKGDNSNISSTNKNYYQHNKDIDFYINDIKTIFGKHYTIKINDFFVTCRKNYNLV